MHLRLIASITVVWTSGFSIAQDQHPRPPSSSLAEGNSSTPARDSGTAAENREGSWLEGRHLTGQWGGYRTAMEEFGLSIEGYYLADWSGVWRGGLRNRSTYRSLTDVNLALDLERAFEIDGATLFLDSYSFAGRNGSEDVGDSQGYSNIDLGEHASEIAELWWGQSLYGGRLRFKIGKVDANSEFDSLTSASDFLNSSAGFSPTIFVFPSYPDPASCLNVFYEGKEMHLGFGFYDGAGADGVSTGGRGPSSFFDDGLSHSYLVLAEADKHWHGAGVSTKGRIAIGGWFHTGKFDKFSGGHSDGTGGVYALYEQRVFAEHPEDETDAQGLSVFASAGFADEEVTEFKAHYMLGFSSVGMIDGRDADSCGFLVTHIDLSDDEAANIPEDETAWEIFYRFQVTRFIHLTSDLQYIINPGGSDTIDDALVGTMRFVVEF